MPIQSAVHAFINERLTLKLDKAKTQQEIDDLTEKYKPHIWIADAARRATQIQYATHTVKGIHPDSKGTNINATLSELPDGIVGSGSVNESLSRDVVGNAAALDVYKFLNITIDNKTKLLDLVLQDDERLLTIFSSNIDEAKNYLNDFKSLTESSTTNAKTYELMKQMLWSVDESAHQQDNYINMVPLYPTSFVHHIYTQLQQLRFSDEVKAAKDAYKSKVNHPTGYLALNDVAYVKLGGTKPQNISQLNSERGGKNYLLPSMPPSFKRREIYAPINETSIFKRQFQITAKQDLERFCANVMADLPNNKNNYHTRHRRVIIIDDILASLITYGMGIRELDAGWSTKAKYLNLAQAFWLDPKRAEIDAEWAALREASDWQTILAHDFALYLNDYFNIYCKKHHLDYLSDPEYREWKHQMLDIIKQSIREGWGVFE